jgi:hypothetical protein
MCVPVSQAGAGDQQGHDQGDADDDAFVGSPVHDNPLPQQVGHKASQTGIVVDGAGETESNATVGREVAGIIVIEFGFTAIGVQRRTAQDGSARSISGHAERRERCGAIKPVGDHAGRRAFTSTNHRNTGVDPMSGFLSNFPPQGKLCSLAA